MNSSQLTFLLLSLAILHIKGPHTPGDLKALEILREQVKAQGSRSKQRFMAAITPLSAKTLAGCATAVEDEAKDEELLQAVKGNVADVAAAKKAYVLNLKLSHTSSKSKRKKYMQHKRVIIGINIHCQYGWLCCHHDRFIVFVHSSSIAKHFNNITIFITIFILR
jgi:hypothetical protein